MRFIKYKLSFKLIFLFYIFCLSPIFVDAADIYVSPVSDSYTAGKIFTATVNVKSLDKSINAVSAIILFPSDKLEVVSISKIGSVINFWAEEPGFSNSNGTIRFEGVVLNPGFIGSTGKIISISFKARQPGTATINFSSGSVLANDGQGTNILKLLLGATWVINPLSSGTPLSPAPESPNKLERFDIKEIVKKDKTDPITSFIFDSSSASSVDHYEISIDSNPRVNWKITEDRIYKTPILDPGEHTIIVRAVDAKGDYVIDSVDFVIEPLKSPRIIDYTEYIESDKTLVVNGETHYPESKVFIHLSRNDGDKINTSASLLSEFISKSDSSKALNTQTFEVGSDESGRFIFAKTNLEDGVYKLWAEAADDRGAKSTSTSPITIVVKPSRLSEVGYTITNFLVIIIPLVAMLLLLIMIMLYGWHKISLTRHRLKKELHEAEEGLHKTFGILREDASRNSYKKNLNEAEKYLEKEIKDINKEIK